MTSRSRKPISSSAREKIIFLSCLLACLHRTLALVLHLETPTPVSVASLPASSSPIDGAFLLSLLDEKSHNLPFSTKGFQRDRVTRILDANTIKLQKNGVVSVAGTRMPTPGSSNFQFPVCLSKSPSSKLRQLVPPKTEVLVKVSSKSNGSMQAVVLRNDDFLFLNQELLKAGFGKAQKVSDPILKEYLDPDQFRALQDDAQSKGLGIFQRCDGDSALGDAQFEAQFEPLELTTETQWKEDGGKQILRQREYSSGTPKNPGDIKGEYCCLTTCSCFAVKYTTASSNLCNSRMFRL
jgi:hypothetical protein